MKINLPSASLCCMSRFYLWPLHLLESGGRPVLLSVGNAGGSFLLERRLPAGPGTATISVSLRDHCCDLPAENASVPGKLAVHGKHVSHMEIWAGRAGGKLVSELWHAASDVHPLGAPGQLRVRVAGAGALCLPHSRGRELSRGSPSPLLPLLSQPHRGFSLTGPGRPGFGAGAMGSGLPGRGVVGHGVLPAPSHGPRWC